MAPEDPKKAVENKRLDEMAARWRLNDAGRKLLALLPLAASPRAPQPSQALEDEALRVYRQALKAPKKSALPIGRWALGFGVLGALTVAALAFWPGLAPESAFVAPKAPQSSEKAAPLAYAPGGLVYCAAPIAKSGEVQLDLADREARFLHHGDTLSTLGAKSALALRIDGRVSLTLLPQSVLRFEETERQLVPRLLSGTLLVDVELSGLAPAWLVLTPDARLLDIGTRYLVSVGPDGTRRVKVESGKLKISREEGREAELLAGQALSWHTREAAFAVSREREEAPEFELARHLFTPQPVPSGLNERGEHAKPAQDATESGATSDPRNSWERTLDSLEPLRRDAVERYLSACEKQLAAGYSQRALVDLERFVASHSAAEAEKALYLLGRCHENLGHDQAAKQIFLKYLSRYPEGAWHGYATKAARTPSPSPK